MANQLPHWPSRDGQDTPIRGSGARSSSSSHDRCSVRYLALNVRSIGVPAAGGLFADTARVPSSDLLRRTIDDGLGEDRRNG